eukprot:gene22678-27195_t
MTAPARVHDLENHQRWIRVAAAMASTAAARAVINRVPHPVVNEPKDSARDTPECFSLGFFRRDGVHTIASKHQSSKITQRGWEEVGGQIDGRSAGVVQRDMSQLMSNRSVASMNPPCTGHFIAVLVSDPLAKYTGREDCVVQHGQWASAVARQCFGHTFKGSRFVAYGNAEQALDCSSDGFVCHFGAPPHRRSHGLAQSSTRHAKVVRMSPNLRPSRRRAACVAIAAAGFLLTISALAPTHAKGQLVKIPLSIDAATVSTGTAVLLDAAALAKGKLVVDSNVPITVQQRVTAEDPSGSDVVTLQSAVQMVRDDRVGSAAIVNASIDRSTVDRISAIPVEEPIGSIQTVMDKPAEVVAHEGLQFKFPFDTQKRTYPYFDSTLRDSYDANFIAEGEIEGVDVYNFRQEIAPVEIGTEITLPASSWGKPGTSPVSMKRFYGITRELSVEPISGAI